MGGISSKRQSKFGSTYSSKVHDLNTYNYMNDTSKITIFPNIRNPYHEQEFVIAIQDFHDRVIDVFYTDETIDQVTKHLQASLIKYSINREHVYALWNNQIFDNNIHAIHVNHDVHSRTQVNHPSRFSLLFR
jgi:hypothetical protein